MTKKIKIQPITNFKTQGYNLVPYGVEKFRNMANDFVKTSCWTLSSKAKDITMELVSSNEDYAIVKIKGNRATVSEFLLIANTVQTFSQLFKWEII